MNPDYFSIDPQYDMGGVGGTVTYPLPGGGSVTASGSTSGQYCPTCAQAQVASNLPFIIIIVAVVVLLLRK